MVVLGTVLPSNQLVIPYMTCISPIVRKLIPYFTLLFVSGYIFSDNFMRFIEFHSDVKVKQIKPVISGESEEETVTPRSGIHAPESIGPRTTPY